MHFEINVSQNGNHLFCTHERSVKTHTEANSLLEEFTKRFPKSEGFEVGITSDGNIWDVFDFVKGKLVPKV